MLTNYTEFQEHGQGKAQKIVKIMIVQRQIIIPIAAFHMKTTLLWQQTSLHNVCICACSHISIHQYIFRDSSNDSKKDKNRVNK